MNITPSKDYKKPLYAIGIGAALLATSLTGCTNPFEKIDYAGGLKGPESTEAAYDGDVTAPAPTEESMWMGETTTFPSEPSESSESSDPSAEFVGLETAPDNVPE